MSLNAASSDPLSEDATSAAHALEKWFSTVPYKWKRPHSETPEIGQRVLLHGFNCNVTSTPQHGPMTAGFDIKAVGPPAKVGRMVSWDEDQKILVLDCAGTPLRAECHGVWTKWAPLPEEVDDSTVEEWAKARSFT